jgi:hypothetical protein
LGWNRVSVAQHFLGRNNSFAPHVDFNTGEGGVWCVKLEDIDNDGKADMLVTSGGSALLSVFRNI